MTDQRPPRNPYTFTREDYENLVEQTPNRRISERSKYNEVELVEDCTLFDIYRQPRAPVTDINATKTLSMRQLNADLTCPICLGIIKETMVVMECLHRFCRECISTAIRHSKRECPSCRIHIPSKRSLRPDTNFDAFIAKVHPNLAEYERHEDQIIEQANRARLLNNAYTDRIHMGAEIRRNGGRKNIDDLTSSSSPSANIANGMLSAGEKRNFPDSKLFNGNVIGTSTGSEEENARKKPKTAVSASTFQPGPTDHVNMRVLLHEDEQPGAPKLECTLFTTSPKLKIRHLKKHLAALLNLDTYDTMCIVLPNVNCTLSGLNESAKARKSTDDTIRQDLQCDQELQDFVTLKDIYEQYGMGMAWELRLLYHFSSGTIVNGIAQFELARQAPHERNKVY
ncbi:hypothetical protein PsorP6_005850 [Peronosclerospora sorghi]|uniref:Uncharacterized protein n=1 Tax=Peronosclerospora sorghi TaxID=230839 RepID=A0ACC0W5G5_9STRA|nr:hypothetical protein PsorP6_005850 [Peronosclerospora sorghi]